MSDPSVPEHTGELRPHGESGRCSGVWPGVCRVVISTLPTVKTSPSWSHSTSYSPPVTFGPWAHSYFQFSSPSSER